MQRSLPRRGWQGRGWWRLTLPAATRGRLAGAWAARCTAPAPHRQCSTLLACWWVGGRAGVWAGGRAPAVCQCNSGCGAAAASAAVGPTSELSASPFACPSARPSLCLHLCRCASISSTAYTTSTAPGTSCGSPSWWSERGAGRSTSQPWGECACFATGAAWQQQQQEQQERQERQQKQ